MEERLDRILAGTGRWTRREAAQLIRAGRVRVDGVAELRRDAKYPDTARFQVDGQDLAGERKVYLMLHKPAGLVSATEDAREHTVLELLPEHLRRVGLFPAGRLDKDSVGLLLLTNDGPLAHALLSPERHVDKTYYVEVDGVLDQEDEAVFAAGMTLQSGAAFRPAQLRRLGGGRAMVTLREGKYHQIKRMLAARGKPVAFLKRVSLGPLTLDESLPPGGWRPLYREELAAVLAVCGRG